MIIIVLALAVAADLTRAFSDILSRAVRSLA